MNGQVYSDGLGDVIVIALFLILVLITYYITYSRPKNERKKLHRREKRGIKSRKISKTPSTERLTPIECKANCLMAEYYQLQLREEQEKYDKDIAQLEEECERLRDTIAELAKQINNNKA